MGKLKTHSGTKKRFKVTGTGKIIRKKAGKRHLLTHKSMNKKRRLSSDIEVNSVDLKKVRRLIPYL